MRELKDGALQRANDLFRTLAPPVLSRGLLTAFEVSPVEDLDEFTRAVLAIGQYFGMVPNEERMQRFTDLLPFERMYGAWSNGAIVGGAGAFPSI